MRRCARWTPEETATLVREWGDCRKRTLTARLPGRTWTAICQRAYAMGLPSRDQGRVALRVLVARFGCHHAQLRTVLEAAGVPVRRVQSPAAGRRGPVRFPWELTDPELAEHAWRAWLDLESLHGAARVRGVPWSSLRTWALRSGAVQAGRQGRSILLPSATLDRIVETRGRVALESFDLAAYLRAEVSRRVTASEREAIRAAQRAGVIQPSPEVRRAS